MLGPAENVALVASGRDLILFDMVRDQYVGLPNAIADEHASETTFADRLLPEARQTLHDAGYLVEEGDEPTPITKCQRTFPPVAVDAKPRLSDWLSFARDAISIFVALRRGHASGSFARRRSFVSSDDAALAADLGRLEALLLWLPVSHRCLPRSLMSARFLRRRGHDVDLVFGVRSHPFDAHCWVEQGGRLLNDELDFVRAYAPIVIGRP